MINLNKPSRPFYQWRGPIWSFALFTVWLNLTSLAHAATPPGLPVLNAKQDAFSIPLSGLRTNANLKKVLANIDVLGTKKETLSYSSPQNIYALSITGNVGLNSNTSAIKVVLIDNATQTEYLVYETYPFLNDNSSFDIQEVCEETCLLPQITAFSLRIEVTDAFVSIRELVYADTPLAGDPTAVKAMQDTAKVQKLNQQQLGWVAGDTAISKLTYEQKKHLFLKPEVPNLQGFEYYRGGIFEIKSNTPRKPSASALVANFDWRNRHGENWVTLVKDQGQCGSCWAFASTGATEAVTNLYFNQHLDLDLAEQDTLSCSGAGSCDGGLPGEALDFFTHTGIVSEACFPYSATDQSCQNKCSNPAELIGISGKIDFVSPQSEDTLKRMIIDNGPVSGGIYSWSHAMALVGFTTDAKDGQIAWIFKNSWGDWGDNGYGNLKLDINDIGWTHAIVNPVISTIQSYQIRCVDMDNDGYCNWGIAKDKSATCPASCKLERDCDDSNPNVGPFDANYNCGGTPPSPTEKSFTIYNDGNADLIVNAIVPETAVPWLSIPTSTPFTISPGSSQAVRVQVASSAPNGTVRLLVNSNDPDENPYPHGVNIEVKRQSSSLPIATRPSSTLPSLNEPTAQPVGLATFYGGIAVNGQPHQSRAVLKLADTVEITGEITVAPTDIGKVADIFIYAAADFPWDTNNTYYYTVGEGYSISPWDHQDPYKLVPFMPKRDFRNKSPPDDVERHLARGRDVEYLLWLSLTQWQFGQQQTSD
jgi:C1A family cysteine protease